MDKAEKWDIDEALDKLYRQGSFEGEHREIHPDRIEECKKNLYKLLVDEMPKRHGDYCGEENCLQCEEYNFKYNHGVDDCLAVIKRVLIGGER